MKKGFKIMVSIIGVIALLGLLVGSFDWAAEPMAKLFGKPVEVVKSVARTVAMVAIAAVVVMAAIASIGAAPVLGVVLLAVGIMTAVVALWPVFSSSGKE